MKRNILLFCVIFSLTSAVTSAQTDSASKSLKVYLNCSSYNCYNQYLKTQTTWIYFVQDQFVADVNLRINSLSTGSGGDEYNLIFEGLKDLQHLRDTVTFHTNAINTPNEIRDELLQHVQLGLIRYAVYANKHTQLHLASHDSLDNAEIGEGSNPAEDPFNAWVYNFWIYMNGRGQKVNQSISITGGFDASQIKETHKNQISFSYSNDIDRYTYDGERSVYQIKSFGAQFLHTKSINQHWSAGFYNNYDQSTYSNYKHSISSYLAVEYNLFPYKESQTKQFTLSAYTGGFYNQYIDTTIYLKTREWRPSGQFNALYSFNQSWGSIAGGLRSNFLLDDLAKNSTSLSLSVDARIYKGLSISMSGQFSFIRNQINLPKEDASLDLVFLQQQVLATNFSYYYYGSINYRFGSIFNNVVNTRFNNEF